MENWADQFGAAVTVVDRDLVVVYMNDGSALAFEKWGGRGLVGKSLAGCHTERSMEIMRRILETGEPHSYTIEKGGAKKVVHQAPWRKEGVISGLVEISFEVPWGMEHHVRG
jgi:transcriptional regulator with PAS, ATPase and Fis domain